MKKILSLLLVGIMVVSMVPTAFATTDYSNGTQVSYNAEADNDGDGQPDHAEAYTVTVPAQLAPGASGNVVAQGTWASNRKLTVTADDDVTLTNSINAADQKVLTVTFPGIALKGSNTAAVTDTKSVSVADISAALFGEWTGHFEYNVVMADVIIGTPALFSEDGTVLKTWEQLLDEGSVTVSDSKLTNIEHGIGGYKLLVPGTIKTFAISKEGGGDEESKFGFKVLEFESGLETVSCFMYGTSGVEKIIFPNTVTAFTATPCFDNCHMTIVYKGVEYDTLGDWETFNSLPEAKYECYCSDPENPDTPHQCITYYGVIHFT